MFHHRSTRECASGFTIPEVIVAGTILIILAVGTLTVFSTAVKVNRGNNMRMKALSVLQREVEHYRSLRFVPTFTATDLQGKNRTSMGTRDSDATQVNNQQFQIFVTIDNDPSTTSVDTGGETTTRFKQITIEAVPVVPQTEGWLQELNTKVVVQRVRSN